VKIIYQVIKEIPPYLQKFNQDYNPYKIKPEDTHVYIAYPFRQSWMHVFPVWSIWSVTETL